MADDDKDTKKYAVVVIAAAILGVVVYFKFFRKKPFGLPGLPQAKRDPSTPETPMPLQAEQYEKYGYPYGMSYDNWLIHGAPVYKNSWIFPPAYPTLPLTKPSDTTMVIPATKEHIFYFGSSQVPEFLTPATFLRVKPPTLPNPQPWTYSNYYSQM